MPVCFSGRQRSAACFSDIAMRTSPLMRRAVWMLAALALWLPMAPADEQQYPPSLVAPTEPLSPESRMRTRK